MIVLPLRFRVIVAIAIIIMIAMIVVMFRDSQNKEEYDKIEGQITFIDKRFNQWPVRDFGKYRYIQMDQYPYVMELFIGKEWGDFKPKFEQVDNLKIGDTITAYYYETNDITNDGINRTVKFIDKNGVSYFEAGNAQNVMGVFVIVISMLLIVYAYYLWKKNKISY